MTIKIRLTHTIPLSLVIIALAIVFFGCNKVETESKKNYNQLEPQERQMPTSKASKIIVFFGNSLTAGFGLREEEAFPNLIQAKLDSLQLNFKVVNAGLSGETTAGGDRRIDWVLQQPMDIFFLELGGNDALRGTDVETTKANLISIITKVRTKHPSIPIILAGMLAPPNLGKSYTKSFAAIYSDLAKEFELTLIPFFLEGVGGVTKLNQSDGIHPNAAGQRIVANHVWKYLEQHVVKK